MKKEIKEEAFRRYPVLRVDEGNALNPVYRDINGNRRQIFLEGAEFASNAKKSPECIYIQVCGVKTEERDSVRKLICEALTNTLHFDIEAEDLTAG